MALGAAPAGALASDGDRASPRTDPFWGPNDAEMIGWLGLRAGQRAADVGCGAGRHLGLLAFAVAPGGSVAAIDIKPEVLDKAREFHAGAAYARIITHRVGDVRGLDLPEHSFDLVWASHLLHSQPDPVACVRELVRVTAPGGRVAVREDSWLSELLPWDVGLGTPGLEYRLKLRQIGRFAEDRVLDGAVRPGVGWLRILADGGLRDVTAKSFLFEVAPPFTPEQESYLRRLLARRLDDEGLTAEDRDTLRKLTEEGGPHDAFRRGDLRFVDVATVYAGRA